MAPTLAFFAQVSSGIDRSLQRGKFTVTAIRQIRSAPPNRMVFGCGYFSCFLRWSLWCLVILRWCQTRVPSFSDLEVYHKTVWKKILLHPPLLFVLHWIFFRSKQVFTIYCCHDVAVINLTNYQPLCFSVKWLLRFCVFLGKFLLILRLSIIQMVG